MNYEVESMNRSDQQARLYRTGADRITDTKMVKFPDDPPAENDDDAVMNVRIRQDNNNPLIGATIEALIRNNTEFLQKYTRGLTTEMRKAVLNLKQKDQDERCHFDTVRVPSVMAMSWKLCEQVSCVTGMSQALVGEFDICWNNHDKQVIRIMLTPNVGWGNGQSDSNEITASMYADNNKAITSLEFLQAMVERAKNYDRCVDLYIDDDHFADGPKKQNIELKGGQNVLTALLDGCIESNLPKGSATNRKRGQCLLGCENFRLHEVGAIPQGIKEHLNNIDFRQPGNTYETLKKLIDSNTDTDALSEYFEFLRPSLFPGPDKEELWQQFQHRQTRLRQLFSKRELKLQSEPRKLTLKKKLITAVLIVIQSKNDSNPHSITWLELFYIQNDYYFLLRLLARYNIRSMPCHRDLSGALFPKHVIYQADVHRLMVCLAVLIQLQQPADIPNLRWTADPLVDFINTRISSYENRNGICVTENVQHIDFTAGAGMKRLFVPNLKMFTFDRCSHLIEYLLSQSIAAGHNSSIGSLLKTTTHTEPHHEVLPQNTILIKASWGSGSHNFTFFSEPSPFELGSTIDTASPHSFVQYRLQADMHYKMITSDNIEREASTGQIMPVATFIKTCSAGPVPKKFVPFDSKGIGVGYLLCQDPTNFQGTSLQGKSLDDYLLRYEIQLNLLNKKYVKKAVENSLFILNRQRVLEFREIMIDKSVKIGKAFGINNWPGHTELHRDFYKTFYHTVVYYDGLDDDYNTRKNLIYYLARKQFPNPKKSEIVPPVYTETLQEFKDYTNKLQNFTDLQQSFYPQGLPSSAIFNNINGVHILNVTPHKQMVSSTPSWVEQISLCITHFNRTHVYMPIIGMKHDQSQPFVIAWHDAFASLQRQNKGTHYTLICDDESCKTMGANQLTAVKHMTLPQAKKNITTAFVKGSTDAMLFVSECEPDNLPGVEDDIYGFNIADISLRSSFLLNPFMRIQGTKERSE